VFSFQHHSRQIRRLGLMAGCKPSCLQQISLPAACGVILFRIDMKSPTYVAEIAIAALASRDDGLDTSLWSKQIASG
jgi:hypothetical protein